MSRITWAIVRPIVTLAMAGTFIWGFVVGKLSPEDFKSLAITTIVWWFSTRDAAKAATQSVLPTVTPAVLTEPPKLEPPARPTEPPK